MNNKVDREKVLWSLSRCACNVPDACSDCNYKTLHNEHMACITQLTADALTLIKKQDEVIKYLYELNHAPNAGMKCWCRLCDDALALLREAEPRVITLTEVMNVGSDFVWTEIYSTHKWDWRVCYVRVKTVQGNDEIMELEDDFGIGWTKLKSEYGKHGFLDGGWRCWTARPTDEQRKTVTWDD